MCTLPMHEREQICDVQTPANYDGKTHLETMPLACFGWTALTLHHFFGEIE